MYLINNFITIYRIKFFRIKNIFNLNKESLYDL